MCPSYPSECSCTAVPAMHRSMLVTLVLCPFLVACIKAGNLLRHNRTSSGWGDPNVHPDPMPVANGPTASQIAAAPWAAAAGGSTAPSAGAWQNCLTLRCIVWMTSSLSLVLHDVRHALVTRHSGIRTSVALRHAILMRRIPEVGLLRRKWSLGLSAGPAPPQRAQGRVPEAGWW